MNLGTTRQGIIHKRYKRFLADVTFDDGENTTIYVPNTGSMKTCWGEGWKIAAQYHEGTSRKYPYSLEMTHNGESWIGINTGLTNSLVQEALEKKIIKELNQYDEIKPEVKIGKSRLDFKLSKNNQTFYLEVKNVTLRNENQAQFPDAVSTRGQKHLKELMELQESGTPSGLLFVVQREDVESFDAKESLDPEYTKLLKAAKDSGVTLLCYQCSISPKKIEITHPLPIEF